MFRSFPSCLLAGKTEKRPRSVLSRQYIRSSARIFSSRIDAPSQHAVKKETARKASHISMPPTPFIPRFLLPQKGAIWRARLSNSSPASRTVHHASKVPQKKVVAKPSAIRASGKPSATKNPVEPLVLEKPTKFNPPSHGARRRKEAPRYPGPQLSEQEAAAQKTKKYPNMMPPAGTFMHWFVNNRGIHIYISLVCSSIPHSSPSTRIRT